MTVFDAFGQTPYTFLEVSRGEVYGNKILSQTELQGVFKMRAGMIVSNNQERRQSSATLHVHPEDYEDYSNIVGNGIRRNGVDYAIIGVTEGRNFDNNVVEHLTFTLERSDYVS